jgi:SAM-dependent methyltransferase
MSEDLLYQTEVKAAVQAAYSAIGSGGGEPVARRLYTEEQLAGLPAGAIAWALGVGNPVLHAELRPGEAVLDLGSGGGIDTILAAREVGPTGRAIGIDLLDEMVERARGHAREAGVDGWTGFRRGEMEDIPLPDASVDVVISNGVINLSPRKSRVLAEIHRVLRPGGRMCVADLTVEDDLPPEILTSDAAWAG